MKRAKAAPAPDKLSCRNCKRTFENKGQYKKVGKREGPCSRFGCLEEPACDGGCVWVVCRDLPSCRSRVLAVELGIDLFTQYPRERLLYEMDVRPANHKKAGWKPIFAEDERVMAGWIYYSWCYPVCMAYAVQIDADDELMHDRWGQPMVMTQEKLGQIMGLSKPNMCRATNRLEARKKLRIDDGRVYPTPKPKISASEREVISTDNLACIGEDAATIPLKYRHTLNDLLAQAPEVIRTDNLARALAFCTDYNEAHKVIRTARDQGIEQVCIDLATLLSRPVTFLKKRAGVASIPAPLGPPAENRSVDEDGGTPVKEVYSPPVLDASDLELLAEADEHDRPELEAEMLADAAEFRRQDQAEAKILAQFDRDTERMRKRGEVAIPQAPAVAGPTPIQVLYRSLPELQAQYPNARFATPRWSVLGKADCQLAHRILDALEGDSWNRKHRRITAVDVTEFLVYVENLLATTRSPMTSAGPKKLGLLIHWAEDWAREAPERRRQEADYRAMQAADQAHQESLQRQQELDLEIDRRMEEIWAAMPDPEKHRRLTATLAELQADTRVKWKQFTKDQQRAHMETYAKRVLRREISEAPEIAQGAGGE